MTRKPLQSTDSVPLDASAGQGCLLLIDDQEDFRHRMTSDLQRRGWIVITAGDVQAGIDLAMRYQPRAIVTELSLPDVRGYYFARTLRTVIEDDVRIVAVTRLPVSAFAEARAAGFDSVLAKPSDPDAISSLLRR